GKRLVIYEKIPNTQGEVVYVSDKLDESRITNVAEYDEIRAQVECPRTQDGASNCMATGKPEAPWLDYADCSHRAWLTYADGVKAYCLTTAAINLTFAGERALSFASTYGYDECTATRRIAWADELAGCRGMLADRLGMSGVKENCDCYSNRKDFYNGEAEKLLVGYGDCIKTCASSQNPLICRTQCAAAYNQGMFEAGETLKNDFAYCSGLQQSNCFSDTLGALVTRNAWNVGNMPFNSDVIQQLVDEGRTVANETVFWRSNQVSMWCDTSCDAGDRVPGNWGCCKPNIDDWRNVTNTTLYEQHACTFCNNSYHPNGADREWDCNDPLYPSTFVGCTYNDQIPLLQCDQRCTKTGDFGSAQVNYAEYFVANLSQCLVQITPSRVYDGTQPMPSIPQADVQACTAGGQCGIELQGSTPLCFYDANGDGFFTTETELVPATLSGSNFVCSENMIVAVNKLYCNTVGGGQGKRCELAGYTSSGLTSITQGAVDSCRSDETRFCPLQLDANNKPQCFADSNGDNLYDAQVDGTLAPSVYDAGTYTCPTTKPKIAVGMRCYVPCNNWCQPRNALTECAIDCGQDGMRSQPVGSEYVEHGWLNASALMRMTLGYNASDQENFTKSILRPFKLFPDYFLSAGQPSYAFSNAISTMDMPLGKSLFGDLLDTNALRIDHATGCSLADDENKYAETDSRGIYELMQVNQPDLGSGQDVWTGWLDVLKLKARDDYTGLGGSNDNYIGSRCFKGQSDGPWQSGDMELCGTVYPDWQNAQTGEACINSQFIFGSEDNGAWQLNVLRQPWAGPNSKFLITSPTQYLQAPNGKSCLISPAGYIRCTGSVPNTIFAANNKNDEESIPPKDVGLFKSWCGKIDESDNILPNWDDSDFNSWSVCRGVGYQETPINDPLAPRQGDVCMVPNAEKCGDDGVKRKCEGGIWKDTTETCTPVNWRNEDLKIASVTCMCGDDVYAVGECYDHTGYEWLVGTTHTYHRCAVTGAFESAGSPDDCEGGSIEAYRDPPC
ncbi:MAG: hypothetical protein V1881_01985, partial [Candidatus Micrarchaeota archaeon]